MNVKDWSEYRKLDSSEDKDKWLAARLKYLRRKRNWRANRMMDEARQRIKNQKATCLHNKIITVFEDGQGETSRYEAEVTYCVDRCGKILVGDGVHG